MLLWSIHSGDGVNKAPPTPTEKSAQVHIPWDYLHKASADNEAFLNEHKQALPAIFERIKGRGRDPVLMLVAFEQEKWRALLALLYKRPENLLFTPETVTGGSPSISNNEYCDVYVAPSVDGKAMQTGVYILEREWLVSELAWVKGLPPMFIMLVREDKQPGKCDVVVLASGGMRVEHLPIP